MWGNKEYAKGKGKGKSKRKKKPKGSLPVAPNVLPLANSHIPAKSCTSPPQKRAMPTTTFGVLTPRAEVLYSERIRVVDANENKPLPWSMCLRKKTTATEKKTAYRVPGLPMLVLTGVVGEFLYAAEPLSAYGRWSTPEVVVVVVPFSRSAMGVKYEAGVKRI